MIFLNDKQQINAQHYVLREKSPASYYHLCASIDFISVLRDRDIHNNASTRHLHAPSFNDYLCLEHST